MPDRIVEPHPDRSNQELEPGLHRNSQAVELERHQNNQELGLELHPNNQVAPPVGCLQSQRPGQCQQSLQG